MEKASPFDVKTRLPLSIIEGITPVIRFWIAPDILGMAIESIINVFTRIVSDAQTEIGLKVIENILLEQIKGMFVSSCFCEHDHQGRFIWLFATHMTS